MLSLMSVFSLVIDWESFYANFFIFCGALEKKFFCMLWHFCYCQILISLKLFSFKGEIPKQTKVVEYVVVWLHEPESPWFFKLTFVF